MKLSLSFLFFFCALISFSQNTTNDPLSTGATCEEPAEFSGGRTSLNKYILEKLKWIDTLDYIPNGKIYIEFEIDTSGNVIHPKIKRGIEGKLDMAVIDAFRNMPKWKPARSCGKLVQVKYVYPLRIQRN